MPANPPEYYRDYDFLHSEKNYAHEAEVVLHIAESFLGAKPREALEVGCGTGNHTREIAARTGTVTAVDLDEEILAYAVAKGIENARFKFGSIESSDPVEYDLAYALFNTLNYVESEDELYRLFEAVKLRLRPAAAFIFDFWNGDQVRRDPPHDFTREILESESNRLTIEANGELDQHGEHADITYSVDGVRDGVRTTYKYALRSKLWSPASVIKLLERAGFKRIESYEWMNPSDLASEDSWKLMYACSI